MFPTSFNSLKFLAVLLTALPIARCAAETAYFNDFSSPASIQDYTVYGEKFVSYSPPPLHTVEVAQGQLRITTDVAYPNGVGGNPVLLGSALLMRSNADFQAGFTNTLANNRGLVSWTLNVANQDGDYFNNGFEFVLGCTNQDPTALGAKGYYLSGGGMVGNRMVLYRFGYGWVGDTSMVIDLTNGLAPLPQMGSFKITFDPATGRWSLYGSMTNQFQDPMSVNTLLGSGIDTAFTQTSLPYFGLGGRNTGLDVFDNLGISVVPEPGSFGLVAMGLGLLSAGIWRRRAAGEKRATRMTVELRGE